MPKDATKKKQLKNNEKEDEKKKKEKSRVEEQKRSKLKDKGNLKEEVFLSRKKVHLNAREQRQHNKDKTAKKPKVTQDLILGTIKPNFVLGTY